MSDPVTYTCLPPSFCAVCRKLSGERESMAQSLQSVSSAKLALQGIITKTKVGYGHVTGAHTIISTHN